MRTAITLAALLAAAGLHPALATDVYWIPAHHLAPQGMSAGFAASDLDGDLDCDISMLAVQPVHQFWNVGTPQMPAWELDLSEFGEVPYCHYRAGAFGDVDDDGDLDLVITCLDQYLRFYRNIGTPQTPAWELEPAMFEGLTILDGGAEPYLADLDNDGDLDLAVSMTWGVVKLFLNVGTATVPAWEPAGLVPGVEIGPGGYAILALGDIDGDGDLDLVGITTDTPVQCWENVGTPAVYEFVENPAMVSGVYDPGQDGGFGIDLLDIDGDGDLDLMIADGFEGNYLFLNEGSFVPVESSSWSRVKALFR